MLLVLNLKIYIFECQGDEPGLGYANEETEEWQGGGRQRSGCLPGFINVCFEPILLKNSAILVSGFSAKTTLTLISQ